jgi:hypothetical protein
MLAKLRTHFFLSASLVTCLHVQADALESAKKLAYVATNVVAAPINIIVFCRREDLVQSFTVSADSDNQRPAQCPNGWELLSYLVLRKAVRVLSDRYGPVTTNEIVQRAQPVGKTLVIDMLARNIEDYSSFGLGQTSIVHAKDEMELNEKLSGFSSEEFDAIFIDTHGEGFFGDDNFVRPINTTLLKDFSLLKATGKIIINGCGSMRGGNLNRVLHFTNHLSNYEVNVIGSPRAVRRSADDFKMRLIVELVSYPLFNLPLLWYAEHGSHPQFIETKNCKQFLLGAKPIK